MNLQIGVKVLIKNSMGEYLFIQRTKLLQGESEVSWDIPGGRIEPDESLMDALKREVREEINSKLAATPILINAQDIFVPKKNLHVVRLTYVAELEVHDITLSDEHQDYVWMNLLEAKNCVTEPYLKETLLSI